MNYNIIQGDNRDTLKQYPDNHFDSIVTDPPYGIAFLGKDWDNNTGAVETWEECFRVLKPGGHILAFSAARTYHHLATNIEGVGFDIRDQLMWLYASGFPKAQDIGKAIDKRAKKESKTIPRKKDTECGMIYKAQTPEAQQWAGWKTALKPAHEPIVMARKPFKGSCLDNVLTHSVGALNIDATRIPLEDGAINPNTKVEYSEYNFGNAGEENKQNNLTSKFNPNEQGRFPSNVMGEVEGYQKYFYCPKISKAERHCGFEQTNIPTSEGGIIPTFREMIEQMGGHLTEGGGVWLPHCKEIKAHGVKHEYDIWLKMNNKTVNVGNNHPTVKPVELMKYLVRLVTPENGKVLDPFCGSGSTGMAAVELGHTFIGCELDPNYVDIASTRITAWNTLELNNTFTELFE